MVDLNKKNCRMDLDNPLHVYWIRYTEEGQNAELNWIQRVFAYGIHSKKNFEGVYEFNFVSYKNLKFTLELGSDKHWRVFVKLNNGSQIILGRIYLIINGGSFWKPNIEYVELKVFESGNYKEVSEIIHIK